jgi:hypothetical protein
VVEDVQFVDDGYGGRFEVFNRSYNIPVSHVATWVVVGANYKYPRMPPTRCADQHMQVFKVVVVPGWQYEPVLDRKRLVSWIGHSVHADICRHEDLVAGPLKEGD